MSASFQFFRLNRFPDTGEGTLRDRQQQLLGSPQKLVVAPKADASQQAFERFEVFFEIVQHTKGRLFDGHEFDTYYRENTFDVLIDRPQKLLICLAPKKLARRFVDEANLTIPGRFNADYLKIDFPKIRPRLREINGIWVSGVQQPNIDVLGLFGNHVDKSQFFRAAEAVGTASSMLVAYDCNNAVIPAIISSNHGIAFPNKETEDYQIAVALHMQRNLFGDATTVELSQFNAKKKRQEERDQREKKPRKRKGVSDSLPQIQGDDTAPKNHAAM